MQYDLRKVAKALSSVGCAQHTTLLEMGPTH
jgi:hypothetical protein